MISKHAFLGAYPAIAFLAFAGPANADTYKIILHGKVVMEDGSAPPVIVAIERICSDNFGSAPGPVTNKKGEFIWQMEIDPLDARDCRVRASHTGYTSTSVEVSAWIQLAPLSISRPSSFTQPLPILPRLLLPTPAYPDARERIGTRR